MQRYRKLPVEIDAVQFTDDTKDKVFTHLLHNEKVSVSAGFNDAREPILIIGTLEGSMTASLGDWIIKGIAGEFYPCKPDIFERTYEIVMDKPTKD